jgi:hypothetical protein
MSLHCTEATDACGWRCSARESKRAGAWSDRGTNKHGTASGLDITTTGHTSTVMQRALLAIRMLAILTAARARMPQPRPVQEPLRTTTMARRLKSQASMDKGACTPKCTEHTQNDWAQTDLLLQDGYGVVPPPRLGLQRNTHHHNQLPLVEPRQQQSSRQRLRSALPTTRRTQYHREEREKIQRERERERESE